MVREVEGRPFLFLTHGGHRALGPQENTELVNSIAAVLLDVGTVDILLPDAGERQGPGAPGQEFTAILPGNVSSLLARSWPFQPVHVNAEGLLAKNDFH